MSLYPGQKLYGFCGGFFGRDSYDTKRIEGIGADWIVARSDGGDLLHFAEGQYIHEDLSPYTVPESEQNEIY